MITLVEVFLRSLSIASRSPFFWLDTVLVALVLFFLLRLLGRSPARTLARGAVLAILLLMLLVLLRPFPALSFLARGALLAILVATPVLFQAELRRMLEQLGRVGGRGGASHAEVTRGLIPALMRAIERLSADETGALIVLEGQVPLDAIVETGVRLNAEVSSELLEAIFYPNNPLHDGAVVLRGPRVRAAACVLPLSPRRLGRLGTRHRAALGLAEQSDALTIVVSEERGAISLAQNGVLQYNKDLATVRTALLTWYEGVPENGADERRSLRDWLRSHDRRWWLRLVGTLILAFGLALLIALLVHVPTALSQVTASLAAGRL